MCVCVCECSNVYIESEREREKERKYKSYSLYYHSNKYGYDFFLNPYFCSSNAFKKTSQPQLTLIYLCENMKCLRIDNQNGSRIRKTEWIPAYGSKKRSKWI